MEVGPGPGYFSVKVAQTIPQGKLVLADIQKEMLEIAKKRLEKRNLLNADYHHCQGGKFPFDDDYFDCIFLVAVFGEVEDKNQYLKEFYRILRPNGQLSVTELIGDSDKLSKSEIYDLFIGAGFKEKQGFGGNWTFTVNFQK